MRHILTIALSLCSWFLPDWRANAVVKPKAQPWLRLGGSIAQLKLAPKGRFAAYLEKGDRHLKVVDLKTSEIHLVSKLSIGPALFWAPDGVRLIYRETFKSDDTGISSVVKAFDAKLGKSVVLARHNYRTGYLSFDPRDRRFLLMHASGLHVKRLEFPNSRLARWQMAHFEKSGRWAVAQNGVLWISDGGLVMRRMKDDDTPVESFDISPDGKSIAWATRGGKVYTAESGAKQRFVGHGRDPDWHPTTRAIAFAGARMVGNKAVSYDIRFVDHKGRGRWLTDSQYSSERWPQWGSNASSLIYAKEKSTDIYHMELSH